MRHPSPPYEPSAVEPDIRPVVGQRRGQTSPWIFAVLMVIGAVTLFMVLDGRRRAALAPAVAPSAADQMGAVTAPEPLVIPLATASSVENEQVSETEAGDQNAASQPVNPPPPEPVIVYLPAPPSSEPAVDVDYSPPEPRGPPSSSAALVVDTTAAAEAGPIRAGMIASPTWTVPQGTLIPAVLETALNSTRPGFARAIVSHDVAGFDGARVLIPRGSRLFGEYQADLAPGQNRAMIQWTRLVRPDGVVVALASPATDADGRAGVPGRVDSHFLARFGNAVLQTTLSIGANLAGRSLSRDSAVVVALPGVSQIAPALPTTTIQPTLRIPAGTRVAVLVARDLQFAGGDAR